MFKWTKKCVNKVIELDSSITYENEEFTIDVVKANYQKYLDGLEQQRQDYKESLCEEIKNSASHGCTGITTFWTWEERFLTYDYLLDLAKYFESKGFKTKIRTLDKDHALRISWEE